MLICAVWLGGATQFAVGVTVVVLDEVLATCTVQFALAPGTRAGEGHELEGVDGIEVDSVAGADHGLAVLEGSPGDADARGEGVGVVAAPELGSRVIDHGIGGRPDIGRLVGQEQQVVGFGSRRIEFPADADVQGEVGLQLPLVLDIAVVLLHALAADVEIARRVAVGAGGEVSQSLRRGQAQPDRRCSS